MAIARAFLCCALSSDQSSAGVGIALVSFDDEPVLALDLLNPED